MIDLQELQGARWFAGKHRRVAAVAEAGAWALPGADAPALAIAEVTYADGGAPERYLLPAPDLVWSALLAALAHGPLTAPAGRLELRATPALPGLLPPPGAPEDVPSEDQSNTLVVLGNRLLIKAYRKLEAGIHPEVELGAALAGTGAPVPVHGGSLHHVAPGGADTAIALAQEFVGDAISGWEAPIVAVVAHLEGSEDDAIAPYAAAGGAVAALHGALARHLGTHPATAATGAAWRAGAEALLTTAAALDPDAAAAEPDIHGRLSALEHAGATPVGRIHGDLHFAQLLRSPGRTLVIDLEGDPTLPLAARRVPDTPLRDVAALLRSIGHIGTAAARRVPGSDPDAFIAAASAAALQAYEAAAGAPVDRRFLTALELTNECRELIYTHRVLPEWAYAPRAGLRRLLQAPQQRPERP